MIIHDLEKTPTEKQMKPKLLIKQKTIKQISTPNLNEIKLEDEKEII
jgi:hypothetical protein